MSEPTARRVLVVEDEPLVAMLIEDMLTDMGHAVVGPAGTLEDALRLVEAGGFDLALLDVNLNDERIRPVAQMLKERGVPFAYATGYGSPESEHLDDAPVLHKPYRKTDVGAVIDRLIANGATLRR